MIRAPFVNRTNLKRRMIREGVIAPTCAFCGIAAWRDKPLSLELDHINGDPRDYRIQNVRLLCPNCHSQTETFSGRSGPHSRDRSTAPWNSPPASAHPGTSTSTSKAVSIVFYSSTESHASRGMPKN